MPKVLVHILEICQEGAEGLLDGGNAEAHHLCGGEDQQKLAGFDVVAE